MHQRTPLLWLGLLGLTALGAAAPAQDAGQARQPAGGRNAGAGAGAGAGGGEAAAERAAPAGPAGRAAREPGAGPAATAADGVAGNMLLDALDRDFDGALSQGEIDLAVVSLRALDRNGDGSVAADEMTRAPRAAHAPAAEPPAPQPAGNAELSDQDGDGKITAADLGPNFRSRFPDFDKNGDGELDEAEQAALIQQFKAYKASGKKPGAAGAGAGAGGGAQGGGAKGGGQKAGAAKSQGMKGGNAPGKKQAAGG